MEVRHYIPLWGAAAAGIGGSLMKNAGQGAAAAGLSKAAASTLWDAKQDGKGENEQINALKRQPGGIYDRQKQQERHKQLDKTRKG